MKAFVLAAGFGTRMGELTRELPKPLLSVGGYPLIAHALFRLRRWGVKSAIVNLHYRADALEAYLRSFPFFPVAISRETSILGTLGGVRFALDRFSPDEPFLLLNPDAIFLPDPEDHPALPATNPEGGLLMLSPRPPGSRETGWSFQDPKKEDPGPLRRDENGAYYYIGCALISPGPLRALPAGVPGEFGPFWTKQAEAGLLSGRVFRGKVLAAGDKSSFLSLKDENVILPEEQEAWEEFTGDWPAGELKP